MRILEQVFDRVLLLEPQVFGDERGWFYESYNQQAFARLVGRQVSFVQDNHSLSAKGVLRGIHFQIGDQPQGKLVRVTAGEVFDVAVDLRCSSSTFGQWRGFVLNAQNKRQLWLPAGFGHAFLVLSDSAEVQYKVDNLWSPEHERSVSWSDPQIAVAWPDVGGYKLSAKDQVAPSLEQLKDRGELFG